MPGSDSPYGGRIIARDDGSVMWQAAAREFPKNRDTDGTLEYAIRLVAPNRTILSSRDGKCLVHVSSSGEAAPVTNMNTQLKRSTKFLIVSGYDAPEEPDGAKFVGKSYYITADTPVPGVNPTQRWQREPKTPTYDVILRYDDYDLERAGLREDVEPSQLTIYYEHMVSVRTIWEHYFKQPLLTGTDDNKQAEFRDRYGIDENQLKYLLVWSRTYHHLLRLGIPQAKVAELQVPLADWSQQTDDWTGQAGEYEEQDIWLSCWKEVREVDTPVTLAVDAPEVPDNNASTDITQTTTPLHIKVSLVDTHFGAPTITDGDLNETVQDRRISGSEITVTRPLDRLDGSRTVVAAGVTRPATFVLVYDKAHEQPNA